ncbi:PREDICTED: zinc finger CCHC domain-containing protein 7-like [Nelumbo nucifera]|uniref:Zinc finger CCHC domain-containing protein 7-like n=1 Tax=Nelumbo nucifera TaxID=4432 RepID=A0A1U7ZGB7_NELNU|nr:PREDICTED: zinc finger CCHC domain-containing protein 7-like [Nelumbo nucifera]
MGKREKMKGKLEEEEEEARKASVILLSSSDDEEANKDLSLEIVNRARMREAKRKREEDSSEIAGTSEVRSAIVINLSSSSSEEEVGGRCGAGDVGEAPTAVVVEVKKKKKKKKKKINKLEAEERTVGYLKEGDQVEMVQAVETVESVETEAVTDKPVEAGEVDISDNIELRKEEAGAVEISDNIVLRKLLRGPRYFDPQEGSFDKCYNCGEEGHTAASCTSKKRKKPCFVCGSFEHGAKRCKQGLECFICKRKGHRAKDCPEKDQRGSQNSKICLRCGDIGHDMYSCRNDYAPDDLKEIQCYVCKNFGHLCCVGMDCTAREVSCYNCGQSGHTGLGCAKSRGETSGTGSPTLCYKCGEEGHIARGCTKFTKFGQRMDELLTPTRKKFSNKSRNGFRSAPHDLGKAHKKKNVVRYEERVVTTAVKSKWRGGWITDDPGDLLNVKGKANGWRSPATPAKKDHKISTLTADGHFSNSRSRKKSKLLYGTPGSHGSVDTYQHRFSASRFGNHSVGALRRNYDW